VFNATEKELSEVRGIESKIAGDIVEIIHKKFE